MAETATVSTEEISNAYQEYEAEQRIANTKVGCILVVTLMPAGSTLDYFVYPEMLEVFFVLRVICSAIAAAIWFWLVKGGGARKGVGVLGLVVPMLPVVFIAAMISCMEGFASPYYAGLNLVLLAIGWVLRWSVKESLIGVSMVIGLYVAAGLTYSGNTSQAVSAGILFNNFYFIALMDVIVVVGTFFQSRQRFREFALRYELDRNKQMLEASHEKLVELDRVKSRFFANISHELRTPLTLLLAPLETLLNRPGPGLAEGSRELLATMHSNGMRLLKLINDLLDLVRLESGTLVIRREPLSVDRFIGDLVAAAQQVADDKCLTLRREVGAEVGTVLLDKDKMEKVVLNLQFNALKFTPAGGTVDLLADREGDELVIKVIDSGVGISKKNLAHVFERFWQADGSSKRKFQGVGIGLSLVKELVEAQGGTVGVESEEGKRTVFTVRLPYEEAAAASVEGRQRGGGEQAVTGVIEPREPSVREEAGTVSNQEWLSKLYRRAEMFPSMTPVSKPDRPASTGAGPSDGPRVLIADDEPDMLTFLHSQLVSKYQVTEAVDGQQALEKAREVLPDLILLDMMMPEKDGLQACRELREEASTKNIPVIILTARADEEAKMSALSAGANDFLTKPFSTTELHVRIKNLIDSLDYQRQLSKQNGELERAIDQLKETETQLVQSEKLASLGRMSAGIIHEINNPLNYAVTGLYTLRQTARLLEPGEKEDYQEVLKDVEEGISRVQVIISDLRTFSYHNDDSLDQVDLDEVMESALRFLSHDWRNKVRVEKNLVQDQSIWANKNKIIQVMVNLLQNSLDAMEEKSYGDGEEPTLWIEGEVEGAVSRVKVRDNGPGIDAKDRDKIFDPFYTTKEVGKGTGLGLSICYKLIEQAEGTVEVSSEPGHGCEFNLTFPSTGTEGKEVEEQKTEGHIPG